MIVGFQKKLLVHFIHPFVSSCIRSANDIFVDFCDLFVYFIIHLATDSINGIGSSVLSKDLI